MTRFAAGLAVAMMLFGCGGSTEELAPVEPQQFAFTATRSDPWMLNGRQEGWYWDVTISGPWAGHYWVGQFTSSPCLYGGGWDDDANGYFNFYCPAGNCRWEVQHLVKCRCDPNRLTLTAPGGAAGQPNTKEATLSQPCP